MEVVVVNVVEEKVLEETVTVVAVDELLDCEEDLCVKVKTVEETFVEDCDGAKNVALDVKLGSGFEELDVDLTFEREEFVTTTVEKLELGLPVKYPVLIPTNGDKVEFDLEYFGSGVPCAGELEANFPFDGGVVPGVGELSLTLPLEFDVRVPKIGVEEGSRVNLPIDGGMFLKIVGDLTRAVELIELKCRFDENVANLETEVKVIVRVCLCDVEVAE